MATVGPRYLNQGVVLTGATGPGATGASATYNANVGDQIQVQGFSVGATGATGPTFQVVLPSIFPFPNVATQSQAGATGGVTLPTSPAANGLSISVKRVDGLLNGGTVYVRSADGSKIDTISGDTGVAVANGVSFTFVSQAGNWYSV